MALAREVIEYEAGNFQVRITNKERHSVMLREGSLISYMQKKQ